MIAVEVVVVAALAAIAAEVVAVVVEAPAALRNGQNCIRCAFWQVQLR